MNDDRERVKAATRIEDLIGADGVELRQSGQVLVGLCPFHDDRNHPSFNVDPARQRYRCWTCGEQGDVYEYVMKRDGIDFVTALERLAERAGLAVPTRKPPDRRRQRLVEVVRIVADYYRERLAATPAALEEVARRGITPETCAAFGIGFAPAERFEGSPLVAYAARRGVTVAELVAVGTVRVDPSGRHYLPLGARIIYPIRTAAREVVGFGGRYLAATDPIAASRREIRKFLNTPQTELFHKNRLLFGLDLARLAIFRAEKTAVVVEGYTDVVIAHQAGFRNVVCTMGTALTREHAEVLGQNCRQVVLAFDPDAGGEGGTRRALETLLASFGGGGGPPIDIAIRAVTVPDGRDPDELILADPEAWGRLIATARPILSFLIDAERPAADAGADARGRFAEAMAERIRRVANPVERELYTGELAAAAGVPTAVAAALVRGGAAASASAPAAPEWHGRPGGPRPAGHNGTRSGGAVRPGGSGGRRGPQLPPLRFQQLCVLGTALYEPDALLSGEIDPELFVDSDCAALAHALVADGPDAPLPDGLLAVRDLARRTADAKRYRECLTALRLHAVDTQIAALDGALRQAASADDRGTGEALVAELAGLRRQKVELLAGR